MKNQLISATVCLILALMLGVMERQARDTSISRPESTGNSHLKRAPLKGKVSQNAVKKHAERVAELKPITPEMNKQQQTPAQLWQYLEILLNQSELQQIPIIGTLLAERLRKHPDPKVYQSITNLVLQPDVPVEHKAILLDLLAETATPDSLVQLLNLANQQIDSPLYILILQAISRIGDNRWDGEFHEELSPPLEAAWSNPEITDQAFLGAIGKAIAVVGAPEGVDKLLLTVSGSNKDKEKEETNRIKQEVAFEAIPQVRNPEAVEVLSTWFKEEPLGTPAFEVSGTALAEIGSPKATEEIVDWATKAPAEGARNLKDMLSKVDDDKSLKSISEAQNRVFEHPEMAAVIDSFATSINSNPSLSTTTTIEESGNELPPPLLDK